MPEHDIIDNRAEEQLVDHIEEILPRAEAAKFAVGYFFASGLESIADQLKEIDELRLLIGNTTSRKTIEQMVEGHKRLDRARDSKEAEEFPKRSESSRMVEETAENIRESLDLMDQTDRSEKVIAELTRLIAEDRLKVRVYTKGRLHSKAYIFDYQDGGYEDGIAVVGSSNFTLSGLTHNTELNVVVSGNSNHSRLTDWFEALWQEGEDFDEALMEAMTESWAGNEPSPYDVYMKALYELTKDRLEGEDGETDILWHSDKIVEKLTDFQETAVRQAVQTIRSFGGVFIADVVGLGKSYIGAAVVRHFARTDRVRPLIICPASLTDMWERYNEVYDLNARVLSQGYLKHSTGEEGNFLLNDVRYRDRDFVLVDESHNFRHSDTQRYEILQEFLAPEKPCCFLTATPRNQSVWDIYHQIKLFHQNDKTDIPIDPPDLRRYFKLVEKGERQLPELLGHILIRRTRNHILRFYGYDAETDEPVDPSQYRAYLKGDRKAYIWVGGQKNFFPERKLETVEYSIEDTYDGLYRELRNYLGRPGKGKEAEALPNGEELTFARYGVGNYVKEEKEDLEEYESLRSAGKNLRGLMRVLLFKRLESSIHAFEETVRGMRQAHRAFLTALEEGYVPSGENARDILRGSDHLEESELVDALREVEGGYEATDFEIEDLVRDIEHDIRLLGKMIRLTTRISPEEDDKFQVLLSLLDRELLSDNKVLIFTQYADTARYLHENLSEQGSYGDVLDVIYSSEKSKGRAVGRFAPKANSEYVFAESESELELLVATDVLSEGLNLQDGNIIVNYDLHWNPVRLIQRFGRIDRIGSEHEEVYGFNFLPELGIERNLGLREKLRNRIQEIHNTIGEDAAILDSSEQLNEEALYAIYEKDEGSQIELFEEEERKLDPQEGEEILRQLRSNDPEEFERITELRDGIRTGMTSSRKGRFVFCKAEYPNREHAKGYQQLFFVDSDGEIETRQASKILGTIQCKPEETSVSLPSDHNEVVMRIKRQFEKEVERREAEREHTMSLSVGQRYVVEHLRDFHSSTRDEEKRSQIALLSEAFRQPITSAVSRKLKRIKNNGLTGDMLVRSLTDLYDKHNLQSGRSKNDPSSREEEREKPVIRVVCSEALV